MKSLLVALVGAVIALGALSATMAFTDFDLSANSISPMKSTAMMMGHVTLTAYDQDGNIIAYRQTDNTVLDLGDNCMTEIIFVVSSGGTCTQASAFTGIGIGVGDSSAVQEESIHIASPASFLGAVTGFDSVVLTPASAGGAASVLITASFLNVGNTITEAQIQNAPQTTGSESVLAIQSFAGIVLGDLHLGSHDEKVMENTFSLMDRLKPKSVVIEDVFDANSISHHTQDNPFIQYGMEIRGTNSLKDEVI